MTEHTTTETTGQARLREAREAVTALDPTPASAKPLKLPTPGEVIHALVTGTTVATGGHYGGAVLRRGQNLIITADMIEASRDRHGNYSGPALVHDELAQLSRHGDVLFRAGEAPADLDGWIYGDPDWAAARERARAEAHALPTADARAVALRAVTERFGAPPVTSTILNSAPDASIRAAEEQQARIAARGAMVYQTYAPTERGGESADR